MIIAVLNQKGGSGKTTLSTNLASALQMKGKSVLLVDADPQGSARDWAEAAENQKVTVIGMDRPGLLKSDIKLISKNYDVTVVDGAPQMKEIAAAAITSADIVLIPVQPSPYDIWAAAELVETVKERQAIADGQPMTYFVVSRVIKNTKLGAEISEAIESYELPQLISMTTQRQIYARSAIDGLSVIDMESDGPAAEEINAIADEVISIWEQH